MGQRFLIYGLVDPRDNLLRYIGKSCSGLRRPRCHALPQSLLNERTHKANWVRTLVAVGLVPEIVVLEEHPGPEGLGQAERRLIAWFRVLGYPLTNITGGGDGGTLGCVCAPETRSKIAEKRRDYRLSEGALSHMRNLHRDEPQHKVADVAHIKTESHKARIARSRGTTPFADQDGQVYFSVREAARKLCLDHQAVSDALHGKRRHTKGFMFHPLKD